MFRQLQPIDSEVSFVFHEEIYYPYIDLVNSQVQRLKTETNQPQLSSPINENGPELLQIISELLSIVSTIRDLMDRAEPVTANLGDLDGVSEEQRQKINDTTAAIERRVAKIRKEHARFLCGLNGKQIDENTQKIIETLHEKVGNISKAVQDMYTLEGHKLIDKRLDELSFVLRDVLNNQWSWNEQNTVRDWAASSSTNSDLSWRRLAACVGELQPENQPQCVGDHQQDAETLHFRRVKKKSRRYGQDRQGTPVVKPHVKSGLPQKGSFELNDLFNRLRKLEEQEQSEQVASGLSSGQEVSDETGTSGVSSELGVVHSTPSKGVFGSGLEDGYSYAVAYSPSSADDSSSRAEDFRGLRGSDLSASSDSVYAKGDTFNDAYLASSTLEDTVGLYNNWGSLPTSHTGSRSPFGSSSGSFKNQYATSNASDFREASSRTSSSFSFCNITPEYSVNSFASFYSDSDNDDKPFSCHHNRKMDVHSHGEQSSDSHVPRSGNEAQFGTAHVFQQQTTDEDRPISVLSNREAQDVCLQPPEVSKRNLLIALLSVGVGVAGALYLKCSGLKQLLDYYYPWEIINKLVDVTKTGESMF